MLRSIGSLHNIPAPSSLILGEFLKLLSTFGDKQKVSTLLEQVREVQANNEQVFRDAQAALAELSKERKGLDDSRKAFATGKEEDLAKNRYRSEELSMAEARLSGKVAAFANEQAASKSALDEKEKRLADMDKSLGSRESKAVQQMNDLNLRAAALDKLESSLNLREQ